ncbi:hypothetical protein QNI19_29955 [Cytophagaceae bacterium DM2B3-1]|uniref:Uncharacterized protein n=2 Tax=Xanthocytophaga TaxID=3078918 RepID=A0AAE3UA79_9BACT|nr:MULTISPECIES: hypothetical protein [Xanthocytophaga]MDJ1471775.1 hypothetical protein [Xanthocytophaga flavus]MDJ1485879.1 hypothetical protein [Xanthocytophaga flavus]MDJ1497200.1 hypothetical protein [Xanthocytophaga flavus]MDJ1500221.1 hypothetical protein [Xanthocytophaga agilis]
MDFLIGLLGMMFMVPLVTGYVANSRGRSFWKWFGIACVLPVVSFAVLIFLPDKSL